jgi:hypothetical protein
MGLTKARHPPLILISKMKKTLKKQFFIGKCDNEIEIVINVICSKRVGM